MEIGELRVSRGGIPLESSSCLRARNRLLSGRSLSSMHVWRYVWSPKLLCVRVMVNIRARELSTFRAGIPCSVLL